MAGNLGSKNGPGYADVADYLVQLTREWGGRFTYTLSVDRGRRGDPNLFVVLVRKPWTGDAHDKHDTRVWSSWPCRDNVTFSGLLFRLCYELEQKLERARLEREQQTGF